MSSGEKRSIQERIEKGKFYFINGKYEYAIKEFEEALKLSPEDPELLYSLGVALEGTNSFEAAREKYLKVLECSPGHKMAREHLDRLLAK